MVYLGVQGSRVVAWCGHFPPEAKTTRVGVWWSQKPMGFLMINSSRASLAKMAEIHLGFLLSTRQWSLARVTCSQPGSDTIHCGAPPEYHCSQTVAAHTSPGNHTGMRFYNKYHAHRHFYWWIYKSYMISHKGDGSGKALSKAAWTWCGSSPQGSD
jgi:hypothetical protein